MCRLLRLQSVRESLPVRVRPGHQGGPDAPEAQRRHSSVTGASGASPGATSPPERQGLFFFVPRCQRRTIVAAPGRTRAAQRPQRGEAPLGAGAEPL